MLGTYVVFIIIADPNFTGANSGLPRTQTGEDGDSLMSDSMSGGGSLNRSALKKHGSILDKFRGSSHRIKPGRLVVML